MGKRFGSLTVLFSLLSANCYGTAEPLGLTAQDNGSDLTIGPGQFGEPVIWSMRSGWSPISRTPESGRPYPAEV